MSDMETTVSDLVEEVKELRKENHGFEYVEITGPCRHPVYARGHLRDNGSGCSDSPLWFVDMEQLVPCPLQDLARIKVWVRNCAVAEVSRVTPKYHPSLGTLFEHRDDRIVFFLFGEALTIDADIGWTKREMEGTASTTIFRASSDVDKFRFLCETLPGIDGAKTGSFEQVMLRKDQFRLGG